MPGTGIADVIVLDPGVAASAQERAVAIDQSLHRLVFYDLRNPAAPVVTRTIPLTDYWSLSGVAVAGSRLVVSAPGGGAVVVDARDGGPAVVSNLQTFGSASRIAGRGGYAFLADGRPGVRVVDLRSPARPPHEAQLDVHGDAWDVYLTGPLVHVAAAVNLAIVDVTNPFAPTIVGETPAQPLTHSIVSTGAYDFTLRNGMSALFAFDVGNPGAPQLTNWVYSGYLPQGMDTDGSYLYLPDLYRFRIYTATPSLYPLGTSPTVGQGRATACAFGTCYFAGDLDPRGTIEIIDVSNPFRPVHRGGLYMPGPALGTAIADNLVLVVGGYSTWGGDRGYLRICDLSRPSAPRVVGALDFVGMGTDVQYWGSAFVTNSEGVLEIDISNPAQPVLVGRHPLPGFNRRLAITNGSAIVASGAAGLQIVGPRPAVPVPAFVSTSRIVASVPQGLPEGPYDVLVTAPDGSTARLTNAYRVCPARGLTLALDPVLKGTGPEIRPPVPWRARLDGDTTLLGRNDGQDVFLELPALPPVVEEQQLVTGGPDTIELTLLPDRATVLLSGRDPSALATRWSSLRAAGRVSLPSRGGNEYGDLTIASAGLVRPASARRYVYTFDGAALSAVRYGGVDADLLFGASIRNGYGCVYDTSVDFAQRLVELCGGSLGDGGGVLCPGR